MYNKCSSCGKLLENNEERRLVLDEKGNIITNCIKCFNKTHH